MASDGQTAYVLNWLSATVTPISTATDRAGRPIPVGAFPVAYAFAPGARTLYVASFGANSVTPIDTATGRPGRPAGRLRPRRARRNERRRLRGGRELRPAHQGRD